MKNATKNFLQYNGDIMFPPRAKISVPPEKIQDYEKKGFVAQLKFNGTRTLAELCPGGEIKLWTRQRVPHKAYRLSEGLRSNLTELHESVNPSSFIVLDGELMNNKTKGLKDVFILFDILVCENDHLVGMSLLERLTLLDEITGCQIDLEYITGNNIAIFVRDHLWLAQSYLFNFSNLFKKNLSMDEIEGLVLKNPVAKLERGLKEDNNSSWQLRCRKPHKNYSF